MSEPDVPAELRPDNSAERVKEMTRLFQLMVAKLDRMIADLKPADHASAGDIDLKLKELKIVHLRLRMAEEARDVTTEETTHPGEFDFDAIRARVQSQMDRLRAAGRIGGPFCRDGFE
ncbi:hypothetical protein [Yoonia sp. 2307UL14-13]|uniref:hypothetical protein n=1 Tax=Yoonia sp. 2307UL14-13 TaxID=3126506 RepID=UPI0030B6913D